MNYELRTLCSKDIFPMFKIISAIGIKDFRACFDSDEVKKTVREMTGKGKKPTDADASAIGMQIMLDVVGIVVSKVPTCENEIYTFLTNISNLSRKEIEDMPIADFAQMIIDVIQKPEFKDFIGVVSKLFK